jgi:UDP:flavonoid glycosyltransferase YjiC (YdhE family)
MGPKVRIEPFVPHDDVLPHVAALVTHGGWGIVGRALRHGVPMLIIPLVGDQPVIAARLAQMGLVHHLPRKMATTEAIREAVAVLLKDNALKLRVQAYAKELKAMDSSRLVADAIEKVVQ